MIVPKFRDYWSTPPSRLGSPPSDGSHPYYQQGSNSAPFTGFSTARRFGAVDLIALLVARLNLMHPLVFSIRGNYIPPRQNWKECHGWPDRPLRRAAQNPHSRVAARPYRARAQARVPPVVGPADACAVERPGKAPSRLPFGPAKPVDRREGRVSRPADCRTGGARPRLRTRKREMSAG